MGMPQFKHIGTRLLVIVGIAVFIGLTAMILLYTRHQESSVLIQNERTMHLVMESTQQGLQTVMLAGYADIAQNFADNLKKVSGIDGFAIMRINGKEAFRDNSTIHAVNRRIGNEEFLVRDEETETTIMAQDDPLLISVAKEKQERYLYQTDANGQPQLIFLAPIPNQKPCWRCHGREQEVRGILRLVTSLDHVSQDIDKAREQAAMVLLAAMALILLVTYVLIRRSVVRPIGQLTLAMTHIAGGNLHEQVPTDRSDELGQMADCFNIMSAELLKSHTGLQNERDKLTTIILSAREGIVVTDRQGTVALVNPSAERLLGKDAGRIKDDGLLNILDDPDYMSAMLDYHPGKNVPEIVVFNNRVIHVYAATISASGGVTVGSAVLLRDITEEKKLEEKLRTLSTTDGLTGLINRRRMDELLAEEFSSAKRYGTDMGLMLFDVDHFKKFNDTHGHDQGDRVLQAIAGVMKDLFRNLDHPCRYGGEEFVVILPNTGTPGAQLAAERLRSTIEAMEVDGLKVTISIGVAIYSIVNRSTSDEMLKSADDALYQAKRAGRNRVMLASAPTPTEAKPL